MGHLRKRLVGGSHLVGPLQGKSAGALGAVQDRVADRAASCAYYDPAPNTIYFVSADLSRPAENWPVQLVMRRFLKLRVGDI